MTSQITKEELELLRKNFPKPPDICAWIRQNVPKSKLKEVKKFLSNFEGYFDVETPKMIEHVYRGIKNSLKVRYAYGETISFARWLLYLLSPDKKEFDVESDTEADLLKVVGEKSFLYDFFEQNNEANSRVEKKNDYYLFDKSALTFLGANVMFYYILTSVVHVAEKTLRNPKYKFEGFLDWQEAIADYTICEFMKKE